MIQHTAPRFLPISVNYIPFIVKQLLNPLAEFIDLVGCK